MIRSLDCTLYMNSTGLHTPYSIQHVHYCQYKVPRVLAHGVLFARACGRIIVF